MFWLLAAKEADQILLIGSVVLAVVVLFAC